MVKHVILWTLKEQDSAEKVQEIKAGIKAGLEGLKGQIPGLVDIKVNVNPLESSNCDVMLDSTFEDEASLEGYSVHPAHVEVANTKVRPFTASRTCMDYVEQLYKCKNKKKKTTVFTVVFFLSCCWHSAQLYSYTYLHQLYQGGF